MFLAARNPNGIDSKTASAVPATLVLFFIRDRLQAPAWEPAFLGSYFAAAALSMPLWLRGDPTRLRQALLDLWAQSLSVPLCVAAVLAECPLAPGDAIALNARNRCRGSSRRSSRRSAR